MQSGLIRGFFFFFRHWSVIGLINPTLLGYCCLKEGNKTPAVSDGEMKNDNPGEALTPKLGGTGTLCDVTIDSQKDVFQPVFFLKSTGWTRTK